MLRDHEDGKTRYSTVFTLSNTIKIFGQDTEFEEVKAKLRPLYKELAAALDDKKNEIEGRISDKRFLEITHIVMDILDEFYISRRFER